MKVLIVINSLGTGGAEKLLVDTIPIYIARGITVDLLLLNGTEYPLLAQLKQKTITKIQVIGKGSVYNPWYIIKLIPHLKKYDLVHVHLFPSLYWVAFAKWFSFSRTPLVYTEHSTSNKRRKLIFKLIDRMIYGAYKKIITIALVVEKNLKAHLHTKGSKFVLIPNGVPTEIIKKAQPLDRAQFLTSENERIIIQVSSFRPPKDQETVINSLTLMQSKVRLLLVGDGESLSYHKALVEEKGLQDKVLFLGIRMDVPQLLKTADVVVLSSHYEGLSLSSIEGLASGKPFVASRVPGLTEVVEGAGILFPDGDANALAKELDALLESQSHYNKTAAQCQERVAQYSIDKMIEKHITLYRELWESQS
jgi:glycosyltransferase involved in cell wall biosynthesis